ncbi:MAG: 23S rRNA (guanosine(2251)-2'-O)-methyltransferase RlmB [Desulfocapsaceae bacterium]|jgi:23S rRNA (guanosine2251-2'-O)-methyltransferase
MSPHRKSGAAGHEHRIRFSEDLLWGIHPVLEALGSEPDRIVELVIQKDRHGRARQEVIDAARQHGARCQFVERLKIVDNPGAPINHQGVVARTAPIALLPFDELLRLFQERCRSGEAVKIVACDTIQDPHNLGAIIRSAHAAGIDYLICTRDRSAPLGGTAAKASAGAISRIRISQVTNLSEALVQVKKAGAWIFGAVKDEAAQSIYQTDFNLSACLVVGNEGKGIRPLVRKTCDVLVSIPMSGEIDSLNSSVAAAVILFEMHRQSLVSS